MKQLQQIRAFCAMVLLALSPGMLSAAQPADIDWTQLKLLKLDDRPLDIAISGDGDLLFILTPGKVSVYPGFVDKPMKQIPVEEGFDRMTYHDRDNFLILTNGTTNAVQILGIDVVQNIAVEGSPFRGPADAPVVLAVFDDYQWPYCARLEPLFQQVLEKYPKEVKLVVKHFPLQSHKMALTAAIAAMAANVQGKFWEFHGRLFENYNALSEQKIDEIAAALNLDMEKFKSDQQTPAVKNIILRDLQNGRSIGVRGTPTLFINGKLVKNRSLDELSRMIEGELGKKAKQ